MKFQNCTNHFHLHCIWWGCVLFMCPNSRVQEDSLRSVWCPAEGPAAFQEFPNETIRNEPSRPDRPGPIRFDPLGLAVGWHGTDYHSPTTTTMALERLERLLNFQTEGCATELRGTTWQIERMKNVGELRSLWWVTGEIGMREDILLCFSVQMRDWRWKCRFYLEDTFLITAVIPWNLNISANSNFERMSKQLGIYRTSLNPSDSFTERQFLQRGTCS